MISNNNKTQENIHCESSFDPRSTMEFLGAVEKNVNISWIKWSLRDRHMCGGEQKNNQETHAINRLLWWSFFCLNYQMTSEEEIVANQSGWLWPGFPKKNSNSIFTTTLAVGFESDKVVVK